MTSKVYFTDLRTKRGSNLLQKLERLILAAGFADIDFGDKFTAIKLHLGEPGNLGYLRPNFAKVVADLVKSRGGRPFLTDANTLYAGRRKNALDHLEAACENGYNPLTTGCQVIIADGLKGTDDVAVPVQGGRLVREAKIGRAIMDADVLVSLSHFKGHESTGFGGAIKNLGMGSGSHAGKLEMHSDGRLKVDPEKCRGCRACVKDCGQGAIGLDSRGRAVIRQDKCAGCGRCLGACRFGAIRFQWTSAKDVLNQKIAEYAKAVVQDRPSFHISLVIDISPSCDCMPFNDLPIIPDVGFLASFDPVALDQACADLACAQPVIPGSKGAECPADPEHPGQDHFCRVNPGTDWRTCLEHGEKIGLGSRKYELIRVE
ncbi:MAG: DUF362 domain-containing protein [Peptococcaceae bacterium]|nr:DUF362 domain-containing protein [Peptococcaceae bacterium]